MNDAKSPDHEKTKNPALFLGIIAACLVLAIVTLVLSARLHSTDAKLADAQKQLTQAKSDGSEAQAQLDKAKNTMADLQGQLAVAKSKEDNLQTKLDQSKDAAKQLQDQLDKSKAQATDQQAQLEKSKAQVADLQAQVSQATAGSAQLLSQLDQAKIQSMDLQARLQKAESDLSQLQPMLLKVRHMPVTTSLEKAHWGEGFTLHAANLSQQPITVNITINGPGGTRRQSNVIGAGATLNVEKLESGSQVTIASDGCDPVNLDVK